MEEFSAQLKKYRLTIDDLLEENRTLEARAKASERGKLHDAMERAQLESELLDMKRMIDRIPPDVLAQLSPQHTSRER